MRTDGNEAWSTDGNKERPTIDWGNHPYGHLLNTKPSRGRTGDKTLSILEGGASQVLGRESIERGHTLRESIGMMGVHATFPSIAVLIPSPPLRSIGRPPAQTSLIPLHFTSFVPSMPPLSPLSTYIAATGSKKSNSAFACPCSFDPKSNPCCTSK